jgi:hypothetical protein
MLLLHKTFEPSGNDDKDKYSFALLKPEEIEVYFTLTSRAESPEPIPVEVSMPDIASRQRIRSIVRVRICQPGECHRSNTPCIGQLRRMISSDGGKTWQCTHT